jgi:SAM-dependent methyltransferase
MSKVYKTLKAHFYNLFGHPRNYRNDFKFLDACQKILDAPCGRGLFVKNDPSRIIGLDLQQIGLIQCRTSGYNVCNGNVLTLPFKDNAFDGVHCAHLIEHLYPDQVIKCLKELDRVLVPGGLLIIRSPLLHRLFFEDPSHIRPYPPSGILGLLNVHNFGDPTLNVASLSYEFLDLKFYYRNLFSTSVPVALKPVRYFPFMVLRSIGIIAGRFGVKSWHKNEYRLVLRKIA